MLGHALMVEIVEQKLRDVLNDDSVVAVVEGFLGLEGDWLVDQLRREEVVAHEHVLHEDLLQLLFVRIHDLELLEGFESGLAADTQ